MQALAVVDGDLVVSGSDYYTISGAAKVKQDLTFALNDEYGADRYHPYWGSILDRFLGQQLTAGLRQQVQVEVQRILANYIAVQTDQIRSSAVYDIKGRFDTSDVVQSVQDISVTVSYDRIVISVTLATLARDTITLTRQVTV